MIRRIITTIFAGSLSAICNFLLVILTAYFLGATARGELALIILAVGIVNMLQDIGGGAALSYFTPQEPLHDLIKTVLPWVIFWALLLPPFLVSINLIPKGFMIYVILLALL